MARVSAAAAAMAAVGALLCLVVVSRVSWRDGARRDALVALPVGSSLVKETYAQDARVGERIIAKMAGRVHSPIWQQLMGSKKMRTALAAAIGAERLQPGAPASAFDLGNLLSGMPQQKREQVKQQLRMRSLPHPTARRFERVKPEFVSPREEWERAEGGRRRLEQGRRQRSARSPPRERARPWEPAMPDRLAANGWQQALSPPQTLRQVPSAGHHPSPSHRPVVHTKFVFDEFAPGVLPGTAPHPPPVAAAKKPAVPLPAAAKHPQKTGRQAMSAKEAVEKATGFGDTIVKVQESPEDKLKKQVQHLKAVNAQEKREFEKREQVDIEHNLVSLEKQQLAGEKAAAPSSTKAGAPSGLSSSAVDRRVSGLLEKDKGAGKKVLGMLKEAAEERSAQEVADGKIPGHLSKGFQTPADTRQRYEEEEKKQAQELEDEVERHAAIISGGAKADEKRADAADAALGPAAAAHPEKRRRPSKAAAAARSAAWSDGFVHHKGYVQGGWRALAEQSKKLARKGKAGATPPAAAAAPGAAAPAGAAAAQPPAHAGPGGRSQVPGRGAAKGGHGRRPRAWRRGGGHSESWETEIRDDSVPIVCGLPLLAEVSGINCNTVKRVHKLKGHNRIAKDLKEVGLGDDEVGTGDGKEAKAGPFRRGGALGLPHRQWGRQLAPKRSFGSGSAIQALGYTSPAQYEKHTLLATIAKEEDTIERLRMKLSARNGGIVAPPSRRATMSPSGSRAAPPQQLSQRQQLETEIAHEQVGCPHPKP